ncbi:hypothetical protein B0H14DRAFT_792028 [Mycena olivaceomarginata]|nr:hypothetical protein B0H14DRAFT_792028 [Mycena olivaceomarginata]
MCEPLPKRRRCARWLTSAWSGEISLWRMSYSRLYCMTNGRIRHTLITYYERAVSTVISVLSRTPFIIRRASWTRLLRPRLLHPPQQTSTSHTNSPVPVRQLAPMLPPRKYLPSPFFSQQRDPRRLLNRTLNALPRLQQISSRSPHSSGRNRHLPHPQPQPHPCPLSLHQGSHLEAFLDRTFLVRVLVLAWNALRDAWTSVSRRTLLRLGRRIEAAAVEPVLQ